MTFQEYQTAAYQFAQYPRSHRHEYPIIGLASEVGEVASLIKRQIRDESFDREGMGLELGDCLWYLNALATEYGFTLSDLAESNIAKLQDRARRGKLKGSGDYR